MKKDFETILDESLSRLKQKESIEACLGRYPKYATQLEPLLRTALKVEVLKDTEPPSAKAMAAGRERFLREAARLRAERAPAYKLAKGPARGRRLMLSVAAAMLIALLLALAALAGFEASATLRRLYHWWETRVPQPTMTQPATDTPWPTMTPHEYQTPATRTLYPAESGTLTCTPTPTPMCTPTFTSSEEPTHRPMLPTHAPTATVTYTPEPTPKPRHPTHTPHPVPTHKPEPTEPHGGCDCDNHDDGEPKSGDQGDSDYGGGNRGDDSPGGDDHDSGGHGDHR